ncbi:Hypothetical protein FKW44_022758 [Caligus rogercresseyi]|uniref:Uncharacterized protein n=1 Tax=Caligus rogercresseyi TaxID=217165 RepID=A0A7T8JUN1_CALRO|nr:Hypothetical protein FKW44_022758 [Caligus rogercresseyi]
MTANGFNHSLDSKLKKGAGIYDVPKIKKYPGLTDKGVFKVSTELLDLLSTFPSNSS